MYVFLAAVCPTSDERVAGLGHGLRTERRVQLPAARVESAVRETLGQALDIVRLFILLQVGSCNRGCCPAFFSLSTASKYVMRRSVKEKRTAVKDVTPIVPH